MKTSSQRPRGKTQNVDKKTKPFQDRAPMGKDKFAKADKFGKSSKFAKSDRPAKGDKLTKSDKFSKNDKFDRSKKPQPKTEAKRPAAAFFRPPSVPSFDKKRDSIFLWGLHAVREAWQNPARTCYRLWATDSAASSLEKAFSAAHDAGLARPNVKIVTRAEIDQILPEDVVHQGIALEVAPLESPLLEDFLDQENLPACIVVLDQVTDPHNVGAILRSAAAFGAGAVIVTERHAPATTGTLAKTASGAADHVPLIAIVNMARALDQLQKAGYWCVGLAEEGEKDLADQNLFEGKTALVLGAEGEGLRRLTREHCDALARLPTQPPIGSLNVSNAAAIALYEVRRQRRKA